MNAASAAYLREQLAKGQNRHRQQALRLELAIQLLRASQTHEAIAELHLLQAQDLSPSLRTRIRDRLGIAYLRLGEQENPGRRANLITNRLTGHEIYSVFPAQHFQNIHVYSELKPVQVQDTTTQLNIPHGHILCQCQ